MGPNGPVLDGVALSDLGIEKEQRGGGMVSLDEFASSVRANHPARDNCKNKSVTTGV